jgi:hypothetical protein
MHSSILVFGFGFLLIIFCFVKCNEGGRGRESSLQLMAGDSYDTKRSGFKMA